MKKIVSMLACAVGFSFLAFMPMDPTTKLSSIPTRLHMKVNAFCSIGRLDFPAFENEEFPHFSNIPTFKLSLVPIVPGADLYGSSLSGLIKYPNFAQFLDYYKANLRLIQVGENYTYLYGGKTSNLSKLYSSLAPSAIDPEKVKQLYQTALDSLSSNWMIPGTQLNFEKINVFTSDSNNSIASLLSDKLSVAKGDPLDVLSQGNYPEKGFATSNLDFSTCTPYMTIPVIYATDQYLDFMLKPIGTIFEEKDGKAISIPSSEPACWVKSKLFDVSLSNIYSGKAKDGVNDVNLDANLRYTNEFRFDYVVDPPEITGLATLPMQLTNNGIASMYDTSGKQHLVQGIKSLSKLYGWIPQTDPAYQKGRLFIKPAVYDRVLQDTTYWQLSKFRVYYPEPSFDNGRLNVEEKYADVEPKRFDEISMGKIAYFNLTNLPWCEGKPNTFFIERVDKPLRVEAVYERVSLAARGKKALPESSRAKLIWEVTTQMRDLAKQKTQEYGINWWKKAYPTYYNVIIKGKTDKKIEKINPLDESIVVEGLVPGEKYTWELQTWLGDINGSSFLKETWKSEDFVTKPLPKMIGRCVSSSIINTVTEVDKDGDEVWVVSVPMKYEVNETNLEPLRFVAKPKNSSPITLLESKMFRIVTEKEGRTYLRAYIKVNQFYDSFEKDQDGKSIITVEFMPVEVMVKGEAVNEGMQTIGIIKGSVGYYWPANDGPFVQNYQRTVEAPLTIRKDKMYRFAKWTWVGNVTLTKMPYVDGARGVAVLAATVSGCQPNPDKPVFPKFYAVYEEIQVDCFTITAKYSINWSPTEIKQSIPLSIPGDCPGKSGEYMLGAVVTLGPTPSLITYEEKKYKFVGWIIGDVAYPSKETITITVDKNYFVLANYQSVDQRYEFFYSANIDGRRINLQTKIDPMPDSDGLYPAGSMVRIGPVPKELDGGQYVFAGWAINGKIETTESSLTTIEIMMDDHKKVVAMYTKK